ncbi:lipopolysaccharide biosynthesis protein [Nocardioides daphniae]|uniref:Polysaccharide biosynthesis protein n=1 Tax=Nocardioides daphniae TaxID=402297 RepID=A0A4P7UAE9_9ACTN|nr:polysaccharide biosynthesis protein [Nocardioides daphniae]QCC77053.1 polysaccharide biosynthesis protein [Nocardioides daphniae]
MSSLTRNARAVMSTGLGIAIAMVVMNVGSYGLTMLAARMLGPGEYGVLAASMNLLLVIGVGALGLQATGARRISAHPESVAQIEAEILRISWRVAWGLGLSLLLLAPVVNRVLKLDNLALSFLIAVAAVPLTVAGGYFGILQGERRWLPLGVVYMASGVPRLVIGVALMAWNPSAFIAFLAVVLGSLVPVALGWWILRGSRGAGEGSDSHSGAAVLREMVHNSQALLAFFALSNVDVIVARNTLDGHEAGLYAGGLILAKMLTFLPQFVVVVAFPAMATAGERTRALTRSLFAVSGLGLLCTGAVAIASPLVLSLVGGQEFAEIQGELWIFALLGTMLALLHLVVYSVLARQGQRSSYVVWAALAVLVAGGLTAESVEGLLTWVMLVIGSLLTLLVAVSYYLVRKPVVTPVESDALV